MGTPKDFLLKTHSSSIKMGSVLIFLYQKVILYGGFFWVSVSALFPTLFGLFNRFFFRGRENDKSLTGNSNCLMVFPQENNRIDPDCVELKDEPEDSKQELTEFVDSESEKESPKFFKFQFQSYEEFSKSIRENSDTVSSDLVLSTNNNKYESFSFEDSFSGSFGHKEVVKNGFLSEKDFTRQNLEAEAVDEEVQEQSNELTLKEDSVSEGNESSSNEEIVKEAPFLSEKDFIEMGSDSDSGSITSRQEFPIMDQAVGLTSDGFLSDGDFEEAFELENLVDIGGVEDFDSEHTHLKILNSGHEALAEEDGGTTMEESKKLEESHMKNSSNLDSKVLSKNDYQNSSNSKNEECNSKDESEDSNGLETLWEHQDLIEQLKMELKKVRATGLPTILEESESPKIMDDLKPWKIDEKFQHVDRMGELHKFYKSYRERMRKFDILNYQKMYAIGFLQSKDPLHSISSSKSSPPAITSLLSQNVRLSKRKKSEFDPMTKFIRELHSDLEVVYVGQLCLSWEILHWQYEKALELWESDPYGIRRYNEVAGELQQFQVLMQRFIENEPFEGPRVQNYVKNRCILRNLLQVPVIREDSPKDKKKARRRGKDEDDAITSDMLVEIMEESIRIFWRFVRADKDANYTFQRGRKGAQVEPQEPSDLELLAEVRTCLHKKEKKLKELLRSGNCILRKFQKQKEEESSDQVLYFFSQVDVKLVSRVLNLSRVTTEQLVWCHNKLSKIKFVNRKIHVEPSFLLFPC